MKSLLMRTSLGVVGLGVIGIILGISTFIYFSFDLPQVSSLNDYEPAIPSVILAKDGTVLAELGKENREIVKFDDIPKRVVDAFLSAEDSSFYEHEGVNYLGLIRAMLANIKAGRIAQGGSTITQQVAKSLLLSRERSLSRKIKDFILAQRIEKRFTKNEILFLYLNQVYLGGGYYGVKSAFRGYFEKDLSEATIAEASMVAGLLVAPGKYSPYINPKRAKIRQGYVLKRMFETGKITQQEYEEAIKEETKFRMRRATPFKAPYFTDWVRQRVVALVGEEEFLTGGYKVQTTLDWGLQKVAEKQIQKNVLAVDKRQGYKGVLDHIEKEKWEEFYKNYREKYYKKESTYFTINEEREKIYELIYEDDELEKESDYFKKFREEVRKRKYYPGVNKDSKFLSMLKEGENYKGLIEYIDDRARAIYVNIGGLYGIIPYEGFRWVHKREISEERHHWPFLLRPSQAFKKGDVILVRIKKLSVPLKNLVTDEFFASVKKEKKEIKKEIFKQRYMELLLEQETDVEGALVSMAPKTGEIVSLVGGHDFKRSQFNRAIQSKRQPGSSFKPILYAAALENGYNPASIILDTPETLGGVDDTLDWKPRNYEGDYKGPITLRECLEHSRNVPTVKIAYDLGVQTITDFVNRIGLKVTLPQDLSLSLGSFGVTLMDMVQTYGIFPNGGKKIVPKSIVFIKDRFDNSIPFDESYDNLKESESGEEEVQFENEKGEDSKIEKEESEEGKKDEGDGKALVDKGDGEQDKMKEDSRPNPFHVTLSENQVYDRRLSYIMTNLLKGVISYGTGRRARGVSPFLGGKTGTTNNYVDAWFIGFSQNLITGVWTGFDENHTLGWGESGAKAALPVWKEFMSASLRKYGEADFRVPMGIVNVYIDKVTGRPTSPGSTHSFLESFVEGTEPGAEVETEEDDENMAGPILEEDDYYRDE